MRELDYPNKLKIGEPRWRAVVRLLIWLSVVVIYYVTIVSTDAADANRRQSFDGVLLLFPLFLIPYLFGIIRSIRTRDAFVFDGVAGDLRKNGVSIMRLDQITDLQLKAVNGTCEELSLCVQGEDNISIELPVDGPLDRVAETANIIAAMTNAKVLFMRP